MKYVLLAVSGLTLIATQSCKPSFTDYAMKWSEEIFHLNLGFNERNQLVQETQLSQYFILPMRDSSWFENYAR